jgi:hypothetical protein
MRKVKYIDPIFPWLYIGYNDTTGRCRKRQHLQKYLKKSQKMPAEAVKGQTALDDPKQWILTWRRGKRRILA